MANNKPPIPSAFGLPISSPPSSKQTYTIRPAVESDVGTILELIKELAEYEKSPEMVQATEESLLETLCFPSDPLRGYAKTLLVSVPLSSTNQNSSTTEGSISESGGGETNTSSEATTTVIAGMAMYFHNYSTWTSRPGIYLEDLFVRSQYRNLGLGRALLSALAGECLRLNCARLDWSVLKWNEPSIKFYESDKIGAKMMSEWVGMRVEGEQELGRVARYLAGN